MAVFDRAATSVIVAPSYPFSANTVAPASRIAATRSKPRSRLGSRAADTMIDFCEAILNNPVLRVYPRILARPSASTLFPLTLPDLLAPSRLTGPQRTGAKWALLLVLSALFGGTLEYIGLSAGLLLGPMIAAIVVAFFCGTLRVPAKPFLLAQGTIGCMIAHSIPATILAEVVPHWPVFVIAVGSVIAASVVIGWLMTRWQVLPGTTAIWGSFPGAATAMTLMAEAYGADFRLVAFMQYLRVVLVAVVASVLSRLWIADSVSTSVVPIVHVLWFPPIAWLPFAQTLALAAGGAWLALRLRIPAGPLLLPMAVGIVLQGAGLMTIVLPPWLLAASYALVGWSIGLRFTRPILTYAMKALPRVLAAVVGLIAVCGVLAALLVVVAGVDPLTAYLATSPGGADSVAIIAASSHVDMPFVMAMQTSRFIVVLLIGPGLARFIARRSGVVERAL
jgi:membrane AbrB-like protein